MWSAGRRSVTRRSTAFGWCVRRHRRGDSLRDIDALIVHSPLVGPTTTRALADALADRGWTTVAPDLRASLASPPAFATAASEAAPHVEVLVGHSGAGAVLPMIADAIDATVTVFVDAIVPQATTTFTPSPAFFVLLDQLTVVDGLLPPWHEWWPPEILARLVPDERVRAVVTVENPRLPRAFYETPIALPERWWQRPAGYIQLSPAYDEERAHAKQLGWPTRQLHGQHLDLLTQPGTVADAVVDLAMAARQPHP